MEGVLLSVRTKYNGGKEMKKYIAMLLSLIMVFSMLAMSQTSALADSPDASSLVSEAFIDPVTEWGKYNDLITAIKAETDYAKRTEMMREAEDILMSNYCVIPLYYYNDIYMQKPYVTGVYKNLFDTKFFMYAELGEDAPVPGTLRINLSSEPDYLDPALNSSVDGACLAANSFSGLYTYNAEGQTVPACAESYSCTEDGLTYTVVLKDGLKWSDGSALTAADFEYSWKRAVADETAADYAYMFDGFARDDNGLCVKAVDDTTLEFVLTAPCAYIEDLMAFPTFYPVKQSEVEANADPAAPGKWCQEAGFVSNGAYVCTEWNHDVSMTYVKNPNFWDAENVKIEKLEFMLSADDTAIYAAYNSGDVDFIDTVPTDEIASLLGVNPEFVVADSLGTYYAAFNCKSELFAGKTPEQAACMREAFSLLIDRDYICENVGQTGQIAAYAYIPQGMADGNGGVFHADANDGAYYDAYAINNDYEGTVAKAIELLKAAGFEFTEEGVLSDATPISLEYLTNESSAHIAIAEAIQADLDVIGAKMTIAVQDWNVFLEERKNGNFDFAREGWIADFNDPINMLEMWITDSGNNDCQFGR